MNESAAREVLLVRAVESADQARVVFNDTDRAWAGRAAAEVVGTAAPADVFLARRAALAVERLGERHPALPRLLRAFGWRPWVGVTLVIVAFIIGVAVDRIGASQRINILAFPLLALLAWNLAVYLVIVVRPLMRLAGRRELTSAPLRGFIARLICCVPRVVARPMQSGPLTAASTTFAADWVQLSVPLLGARVSRILHLAAAAFAFGAVVGMYVRGLVFEYLAGWESTFIGADTVQRLLAFALAPGAALTGIAVPGAEHLETIRFSTVGGGENAASWIHLYAATVAIVVLAPRLLLAAAAWFSERRIATHFPIKLDETYFQRLQRAYTDKPARIHVVPYSFTLPETSVAHLNTVLMRVFGMSTTVSLAATVAYGDEDDLPAAALPTLPADLTIALFNLTATPETENHGTFAAALTSRVTKGMLLAIVDEAGFRKRFVGQTTRLDERRNTWRQMLSAYGLEPVLLDLSEPDLAVAENALNLAVERRA